jgi:hypothetical protein
MPLTEYCPGQKEKSHYSSVRIGSIMAKRKAAKVN